MTVLLEFKIHNVLNTGSETHVHQRKFIFDE